MKNGHLIRHFSKSVKHPNWCSQKTENYFSSSTLLRKTITNIIGEFPLFSAVEWHAYMNPFGGLENFFFPLKPSNDNLSRFEGLFFFKCFLLSHASQEWLTSLSREKKFIRYFFDLGGIGPKNSLYFFRFFHDPPTLLFFDQIAGIEKKGHIW